MKSVVRILGKSILAAALILTLLAAVSPVLANKGVENEDYSAIATYRGFYREPEDSLDVLFLGTSHAYCAFSPNELEKETGLKSYNLASSQQSLLTSYYWLKEALRYQHPKAVVLDCFYCFYEVGNEGSLHKAFDWMNLSPVKVEAVNDLCSVFPDNGKDQYHRYQFLIPALRYHDRWSQLTSEDWHWMKLASEDEEKGYCRREEKSRRTFVPIPECRGKGTDSSKDGMSGVLCDQLSDFLNNKGSVGSKEGRKWSDSGENRSLPLNEDVKFADTAPQSIPEFQMEYLNRIANLCAGNEIQLLLVKTPTIEWTPAQHDAVQQFADANQEKGVSFLDFNMDENLQKIKYDFASDNADTMHANQSGAVKLTDGVGVEIVHNILHLN